MNKKTGTFLLVFTLLSQILPAQSKWSLGLQAGRTQLVGYTGISYEQIPEFEAQGHGGVNILIYGKFNIYKKASIFAGGGINNLVSGMKFQGKRGRNIGTKGVTPQYFIGFDYDLPFGVSGFGLMPRLTFGMTGSNAIRRNGFNYLNEQGEFPIIGWWIRDEHSGDIEDRQIYVRELKIFASDYKFIYQIRHEMNVYKRFGPHQISLSAIWAFAPDRDYYREEYRYLEFKGNRHTAYHRFGGHYTALLAGYEFRF